MRNKEKFELVNKERNSKWLKPICYITFVRYYKKHWSLEPLFEIKSWSWCHSKWRVLKSMRKLSDKDIEKWIEMIKNWYKLKDIASYFKVSNWYFNLHKKRLWL